MKYLAAIPLSPTEGFSGPGTGPLATGENPESTFSQIISTSIGVITAIAFIYFLYRLVIGAVNIITAGSDKGKLEDAKKTITTAIIGLVVTISAIFIADLVGEILGVDILNPIAPLLAL